MTTANRNVSIGITIHYGARDEASAVQSRVTQRADAADKSFQRNTRSLNQLAAGLAVVGGGMLAMSSLLRRSNNEFAQTSARVLEMTGLFFSGVAGVLAFVSALDKVIVALRQMRNAQLALAAANVVATATGGGGIKGIAGRGIGAGAAGGAGTAGAAGAVGLGAVAVPAALAAAFGAVALGALALNQRGGPLDIATPIQTRGREGFSQNIAVNVGNFLGNESDAKRLAREVGRHTREETRRGAGGQRNR